MKLQLLKEKIKRYIKILRHYGFKLTITYYLGQQSEEKYFNFRKKMILNFVYNLREKADINNIIDMDDMVERDFPKIVWTMWQQGEAQMPETVKATVKTIKEFAERSGCEFHLLTDKNLKRFVNIPKDITEKYNKKELSAAHYSDIVRFSLLYQYGGIWMDATLFVSPYATLEMFEGDFFSLNHPPTHPEQIERTIGDFKWSGFLLAGKKEKTYFKHIYELYIYFVRKYSFFISYLMMDYFILSEYELNEEFKVSVDDLPILAPAERVWFLREHADKFFDEKEWEEVLKMTPILKTTYKINEKEIVPNSYLYKLYHDELNE